MARDHRNRRRHDAIFHQPGRRPQAGPHGRHAANYGYCVFGEVTEGLDVAEKISHSPTTDLGGDLIQSPNPPVVIKAIRVVR